MTMFLIIWWAVYSLLRLARPVLSFVTLLLALLLNPHHFVLGLPPTSRHILLVLLAPCLLQPPTTCYLPPTTKQVASSSATYLNLLLLLPQRLPQPNTITSNAISTNNCLLLVPRLPPHGTADTCLLAIESSTSTTQVATCFTLPHPHITTTPPHLMSPTPTPVHSDHHTQTITIQTPSQSEVQLPPKFTWWSASTQLSLDHHLEATRHHLST